MESQQERVKPAEGSGGLLSLERAKELARSVPEWHFGPKAIEREWRFANFREAMSFVNKVAEIAESENHHPDIWISYNMVRLTFSTHKVGGLSEKDFVAAAKVDQIA